MTDRPLLAAGTGGALLVAAGALGAGAVPVDGDWLGLPAGGARTAGGAAVAAGVLVLLAAWWPLRDRPAGVLRRAAALWVAPLLLAPPLLSRDVYAYAGQAVLDDPYAQGPEDGRFADEVDEVWRGTPSPYGPAFLGPARALLSPVDDADVAVLLLRALAVLGLVLTALALPVLARAAGVPEGRALWLGLANPLGLLHGVGGAHNDALMVGLMVAALAVAARTGLLGVALAGVVGALAGLVKAPALVVLGAVVLAQPTWPARLRAGAVAGAAAAVTAVLVALASGLGGGWLGTLDAGRARLSLLSPVTGLATLLDQLVDGARDAVLDAAAPVAVLVAAAVLLVVAPRRGAVAGTGWALLAVVALSPTVLPWYLLWAAVPLAAVAGPRLARGLGAACAALCLAVWPSGRFVVRPPLYGVAALLAALAGVLAARRSGRVPA